MMDVGNGLIQIVVILVTMSTLTSLKFAWLCLACDVLNFDDSFFNISHIECSNCYEILGDTFLGNVLKSTPAKMSKMMF